MRSSPSDNDADTTAWYASFWAFVSGYLGKRFGKRYCLNPEASLMLHTGNTTVPRQVTCVTINSGTSKVDLPFDTSLLALLLAHYRRQHGTLFKYIASLVMAGAVNRSMGLIHTANMVSIMVNDK